MSSESVLLGASFREVARTLSARWWVVLLGACSAAFAAGALVALQRPVYEARVTLTVDVGSTPAGTATGQRLVAEAIQLVRSDAVRRSAADSLGLRALEFDAAVTQVAQTAQVRIVVRAGDPDSARHVADALGLATDTVGRRRAVASFDDELEAIAAETTVAAERLSEVDAELSDAPDDADLTSERGALQARLDVLAERLAEAQVDAALATSGVVVDSPARAGDAPVAPTPLPTIALAALAGGLIGAAGALLRRRPLDGKSPSEWEAATGLPVLADLTEADLTEADLTAPQPADALRGLRVALQHERGGPPNRSVALVGVEGEAAAGTVALVAAAVGRASAAAGVSTLLIDADLPSRALTAQWGLPEGTLGLSDALRGGAPADSLQRLAERCWIVPAGGNVGAAGDARGRSGDLLAHPRAAALIAGWAHRAELTIVACPSAGDDGAAGSVAAAAQRTVLVARRDAEEGSVVEAARRLRALGVQVGGLVLVARPRAR